MYMSDTQRYFTDLITPMSAVVDLLVINLFAYFLPINLTAVLTFHTYISVSWLITAFRTHFYQIQRFSKVTYILRLLVRQFAIYILLVYAFIGFFKQPNMSRLALAWYVVLVFLVVSTLKLIIYFLVLKYRERFHDSSTRVVVVGMNKKTSQLISVFKDRQEFGYQFIRRFAPREKEFDLQGCFQYILDHQIDEIYCSISEMRNEEITAFINFADNNLKALKFLPDNKNIYSKKLKFEYYDYLPILSLRDIPLHNAFNAGLKRGFDIAFSLAMILGVLIWLGPIMAILIRLESKGPLFFAQKRSGLDNKEFYCYKFRSMAMNKDADRIQAGKNDMRITRIGKFIRKTSIDELPQFYNVLFGNMSVVGPRPHMLKHTDEYASRVDKYMVRHFIKPGITGLAQVRGYRGEIETDSDIQNRVKFDIFYIENWSFLLDMKIIVQTILNVFKGEDKAY